MASKHPSIAKEDRRVCRGASVDIPFLILIVLLPFIVLIAGRMRNRKKHKRVQERKEENHDRS